MKTEFLIQDLFRLSNGTTVLACACKNETVSLTGQKGKIQSGNGVRQELTLIGIRQMLNQSLPPTIKGIETNDSVNLSIEEAQSGLWSLLISK